MIFWFYYKISFFGGAVLILFIFIIYYFLEMLKIMIEFWVGEEIIKKKIRREWY